MTQGGCSWLPELSRVAWHMALTTGDGGGPAVTRVAVTGPHAQRRWRRTLGRDASERVRLTGP